MKPGTIDVWAQNWYKPDKLTLQAVADDLNVKVVRTLDGMWAEGWRPSWRWEQPAKWVSILPVRRGHEFGGEVVCTRHGADLTLNVQDTKPLDTRLSWIIAHELTHCYFSPCHYPYNQEWWDLAHHARSWEQVADEVASKVVNYTREEYNIWALADRQGCVTNSPDLRGG